MKQQKPKPNPNQTGHTESKQERDGSSLPRTGARATVPGWGGNAEDIEAKFNGNLESGLRKK